MKIPVSTSFRHGFAGFARLSGGLLILLFIAGCGSLPGIATHVNYACQAGTDRISTFRVEFEQMPEFLKPMLRDEAAIVLRTKNLDYVEGEAHSILTMKLINRTLDSVDEAQDEAWERIAPGGGVRFIAEVNLDMRDAVSGERIWGGTMSRVHNVYEGSYMHDAPARAAMRRAFMNLFADYPSPVVDDCR